MTSPWVPQLVRHEPHRALLDEPFPVSWQPHLRRLPFYHRLDADGQERLRADLRVLVLHKHWHGHGILVDDEIKVVIAAQAALLLLNLEHDYYPNVHTILVHPTRYRDRVQRGRRRGDGANDREHDGEAMTNGVVVLAWDAVQRGVRDPHDGRNLVFHEFAHELDLLDGKADGRPPLPDHAQLWEWSRVFNAQFAQLREQVAAGKQTLLDSYGAKNRAEFFAIATECFFERGLELAHQHPDLYLVLWRFYGQDPAGRC